MEHNISIDDSTQTVTISLSGELDHHSAGPLRDAIDERLRGCDCRDCVIDMTHVSFMDSSGLGVILGRYRLVTERGGRLTVKNPNTTIDRILRMSGIYSIAEVTKMKENKQ